MMNRWHWHWRHSPPPAADTPPPTPAPPAASSGGMMNRWQWRIARIARNCWLLFLSFFLCVVTPPQNPQYIWLNLIAMIPAFMLLNKAFYTEERNYEEYVLKMKFIKEEYEKRKREKEKRLKDDDDDDGHIAIGGFTGGCGGGVC